MQSLMRLVCLSYMAYLTALLLVADPTQLVGGAVAGYTHALGPVAHLVSFMVLAVLALMTRWPAPRWLIVVLLIAYGGMTEIVQNFLPSRTAEWGDWLQDVVGIGIGAAACWAAASAVRLCMKSRRTGDRPASSSPSDSWEALQNVASCSTVADLSWWR
jgi:hypothetical protein